MITIGDKSKAYKDALRYLIKQHCEDADIRKLHHDLLEKGLCECPVCLYYYGGILNAPKAGQDRV